jgi:hypothetical protein
MNLRIVHSRQELLDHQLERSKFRQEALMKVFKEWGLQSKKSKLKTSWSTKSVSQNWQLNILLRKD